MVGASRDTINKNCSSQDTFGIFYNWSVLRRFEYLELPTALFATHRKNRAFNGTQSISHTIIEKYYILKYDLFSRYIKKRPRRRHSRRRPHRPALIPS